MRAAIAIPRSQPDHLSRAAFAVFVAAVKGGNALDAAARLYHDDLHTRAVLTRAAVDPAKTSEAGWASELVHTAFRRFLAGVEPLSAAARLIAMGIPAQLDGAGEAKYPVRSGSPAAAPWVAESGAIPVVARQLGSVALGPRRKIALISVLSQELASRADGEATLTQILREDAAYALDAAYFATTTGSASAHAGLLNGVTPLAASTEGGTAAMVTDLMALASAVAAAGSGRVASVASTGRAASTMIAAPDLRATVLASPAVPEDRVIAVDPLSLLHSTDPSPEVSAAKHTAIHMDDAPGAISAAGAPNVVAAPVTSLFQTAQIALRVLADMAWAKRRSGAVAYLDGADWS